MTKADLVGIGKRIQNRRKKLGYTQEQLADLMNVSVQMVSNLERGNKAIRIENLIKLSRILEISTDYILTGKEKADSTYSLMTQIGKLSDREREMINILVAFCLHDSP